MKVSDLERRAALCARLRAQLKRFRTQLAELNEKRDAVEDKLALALSKWPLGQRLLYCKDGEYELTSVRYSYGMDYVRYFGRKVLKSGALHAREVELWRQSPEELRPVAAPKSKSKT